MPARSSAATSVPAHVLAQGLLALPAPLRLLTRDGALVFESDACREWFAGAAAFVGELSAAANAGHPSALRAAAGGDTRVVPLGEVGGRETVAHYFPVRDPAGAVTHVGVLYREAAEPERSAHDGGAAAPPLSSTEHATPVEQQLRFVIDMVPQLIWSTQPDGYHDFYNRRWYEYIGARPDETRGAGWNDPLHPDDQQRAWQRWQRSLATGEDYEIEYRFRRHDGTYRWFLARALPMRDDVGRIVRWFGTCTDIDDQKRLAAERAEVLAESQANSRMKDEFLAVVSHELRTPLTSILGWAKILQSRPEMAGKAIEVIERNARAQAKLIEELLEISRIITGKTQLQVGALELRAVVQSAVDTVRPAAEAKHVALDIGFDPHLGRMAGDADRLQQVAWNLLVNAVKFTPAGGRVTVDAAREDSQVVLTVRDTGCGIAPTFLPHVFERFRQAEGGTTRQHGGLGLGLAIVKHLVELHGGKITAESPGEGHGATFTVRLPVRAVLPEAAATPQQEPAAADADLRLDGLRVLVVDDEPDARELIAAVLRHAGADTREAPSADAALEEIARAVPDVLVSDIGMPTRDGYGLMRALRQRDATAGGAVPGLALTAYARVEDQQRAFDAGFQMHLAKPIEPSHLVAAVHRLSRRDK